MYTRTTWEDLDLNYIQQLVEFAKNEDLLSLGQKNKTQIHGDLASSLISSSTSLSCKLVARRDLVPAGLGLIELILNSYQESGAVKFELLSKDGALVSKGQSLARIYGPAQTILKAERVILNFIQKLSGIATLTNKYVQALKTDLNGKASAIKLCDTRKTTPGYRMLEKYAVSCGGAYNHRLGLNHWPMFKDNHLSALGLKNLAEAANNFRRQYPGIPIEVEVDSLDQLAEVLTFAPEIILLDNFDLEDISKASQMIRKVNPKILIEVSGNVTIQTLTELSKLPIDIISTGAITHQSTWVDIGLDWEDKA